jgi:DNA-directed RNA polymerase II subunit RPB2
MDNDSKINYLKGYIKDDILPHLGNSNIKKAYFVGIMVKKLMDLYLMRIPQDDRDSYVNKRIDTPGILMSNIFRQYFTKLIKDMRNSIMKELSSGSWKTFDKLDEVINLTNIYKIIKSTTIEIGLKYSLATGNWGMKNASKKVGVAQVLSRLSYNSTLSHLRRLNTPIEKTGKLIPPRKLHPTTWGYICPAETPEGASVGIVKNLALLSTISIYNCSDSIATVLDSCDVLFIDDTSINDVFGKDKIFINGDFVAVSSNAYEIYIECIKFRRLGVINIYTSICFDYQSKELYFYTDAGRLLRPLLIVSNNDLLLRQEYIQLVKEGKYNLINLLLGSGNKKFISEHDSCLEFIDVQENNNLLIANNINDLKVGDKNYTCIKNYTHCEIHSSAILGILASAIPFPDHNQSPRNTYQSAMGKQAMGIYSTNFNDRMDTLAHILHYPTVPLVNTTLSKYLNSVHTPNGSMVVVAIMSGNGGYNQEDSVMLNKSSIECGMFVSTFFRSYKDEEKKSQIIGKEERFCRPNTFNTKGMKPGDYSKLDENGFAKINSFMKGGDIIIGKHLPCKDNQNNLSTTNKFRDSSTSLRSNESGIVDKRSQNRNGDGYSFIKLRMRSERVPQIGDKFSSRHGQKGTVGMVYRQQDMPYTKDGIVPDIIINPHAIPSRMTIGQLVECITGKACCMLGLHGDGTPFTNLTVNEIGDILQNEANLERNGNEVLYNGFTGRQLECSIFMGPTYYQRLKHMVDDKIHSRSSGPLVLLTRQPSEGRSRDGGLRFGEMERDCMIAHGVSVFQKERLLDMSDNYRVFICRKTGMISAVNEEKNIYNSFSSNTTDFSEIRLPYAYKLLVQELQTMGICSRLITG